MLVKRYRLGPSPCAQHPSQGAEERERLLAGSREALPFPRAYGPHFSIERELLICRGGIQMANYYYYRPHGFQLQQSRAASSVYVENQPPPRLSLAYRFECHRVSQGKDCCRHWIGDR